MGEQMDQSKSNSSTSNVQLVVPKRTFNVELLVGIFTMLGVAASGYLAVGLAGLQIGPSDSYIMFAEFDNVSGLKYGASVEIAGVPVGEVTKIELKDPKAIVSLKINNSFRVKDDDILSIRTKGIIGDRYVKVSRGASDNYIPVNGTTKETESVVDIEDVIGKVIHSLSGDKEEETPKEK
jgi:phospholipid/cholesterol/gamma-HCH transport system substrate-binding protein